MTQQNPRTPENMQTELILAHLEHIRSELAEFKADTKQSLANTNQSLAEFKADTRQALSDITTRLARVEEQDRKNAVALARVEQKVESEVAKAKSDLMWKIPIIFAATITGFAGVAAVVIAAVNLASSS